MRNSVAEQDTDILVSVEAEGLAVVTLNRPARRNAVSLSMWNRLEAIFLDLKAQPEVKAVILTGAGGQFCAGADISEFSKVRSDAQSGRIYEAATERAARAIRDYPRPTIAAVSGFGVGGGCGLALCCDFRVGDATTRMGIPAARLGIVYGALDTLLLHRQVGFANAKRVLFSARFFEIDDCVAMKLVDVRADGSALDGARALADEFLDKAPMSIEGAKAVLEMISAGEAEAREAEILAIMDQAMESEDYREGGRAFLEKRKPRFIGR
nr:enoyl-CoA hydratase-related protein [Xanthobacter sp. SG618]